MTRSITSPTPISDDADDDRGVEQALPPSRAAPLRSQSDTCAGCTVSRNDALQVGAQQVELDLLAQPRAERLERALRVVAAPVEAAVDEPLHARAQRQEQRGDTSVEPAIARFEPPANDENTACPASTSPA